MARIGLKNLRHSYREQPAGDADWALKRLDLEWADGGAYALLGPVRLRQDHAAQHHLGPAAADRRARSASATRT